MVNYLGSLITGVVRGPDPAVHLDKACPSRQFPSRLKIRDMVRKYPRNGVMIGEEIGLGTSPAQKAVSSSTREGEKRRRHERLRELWRVPAILGGSGNAGIEAGPHAFGLGKEA